MTDCVSHANLHGSLSQYSHNALREECKCLTNAHTEESLPGNLQCWPFLGSLPASPLISNWAQWPEPLPESHRGWRVEDSSVKNNNAWLSHKGAPSTRSWTGPSDVLLLNKHLLLADIPNAWGQTRSRDTQSQDSRTSKGTTRQLRPQSVRRFQLHHTPILTHGVIASTLGLFYRRRVCEGRTTYPA